MSELEVGKVYVDKDGDRWKVVSDVSARLCFPTAGTWTDPISLERVIERYSPLRLETSSVKDMEPGTVFIARTTSSETLRRFVRTKRLVHDVDNDTSVSPSDIDPDSVTDVQQPPSLPNMCPAWFAATSEARQTLTARCSVKGEHAQHYTKHEGVEYRW